MLNNYRQTTLDVYPELLIRRRTSIGAAAGEGSGRGPAGLLDLRLPVLGR